MKILLCLPVWAYVPGAALPGNVCVHTNTQKFGLWGKVYEHKGTQRAGAVFQGKDLTTYVFWMGSSSSHVCFTRQNKAACSHFWSFGLPAAFLRVYTPLSHRAVCLGGSFLATCSPGQGCDANIKNHKKGRDREIFITEVHLENSLAAHWAGEEGGCPPACLCFVRQVRICVWLAAAPLPGAEKQEFSPFNVICSSSAVT